MIKTLYDLKKALYHIQYELPIGIMLEVREENFGSVAVYAKEMGLFQILMTWFKRRFCKC